MLASRRLHLAFSRSRRQVATQGALDRAQREQKWEAVIVAAISFCSLFNTRVIRAKATVLYKAARLLKATLVRFTKLRPENEAKRKSRGYTRFFKYSVFFSFPIYESAVRDLDNGRGRQNE